MEFSLQGLELSIRIRPEHAFSDEELLRFPAANDVLRIEAEPNRGSRAEPWLRAPTLVF